MTNNNDRGFDSEALMDIKTFVRVGGAHGSAVSTALARGLFSKEKYFTISVSMCFDAAHPKDKAQRSDLEQALDTLHEMKGLKESIVGGDRLARYLPAEKFCTEELCRELDAAGVVFSIAALRHVESGKREGAMFLLATEQDDLDALLPVLQWIFTESHELDSKE